MSDAFKPWSAAGVTSKLGDQLAMTYGESTSAVLGLNGSIVLGNKLDYIIDPAAVLGEYDAALRPVLGTLLGRTQIFNCQRAVYQLGQTTNLLLSHKALNLAPTGNDMPLLAKLWHVSNLCSAVAMFWTVGAGKEITTKWYDKNAKLDEGLNIGLVGLAITPALTVLVIGMLYAGSSTLTTWAQWKTDHPITVSCAGAIKDWATSVGTSAKQLFDCSFAQNG
jgi:hypothetical protein